MDIKEILKQIIKYIDHLEDSLSSYESKLKDMELDDMLEEAETRNVTVETIKKDWMSEEVRTAALDKWRNKVEKDLFNSD